ncbi:alpha-protein kinase 1-like [Sphaeramia orbicularis]|uniref:alpha-protein kinase 1-like n=1 Tax=Sphaeramia orbicularis TaxID=375764 RepID=UPI00117EC815|nr:alpha-protein kinase 1-like [Sphaeramia orbicularis]
MDSQVVGRLLDDCLNALAKQPDQPTETQRLSFYSCREGLCAELASLLQEAIEMKWPFVPEKWQYKQAVGANDKTNLSDLIRQHLPQLLAFLKATIVAQEARSALSVAFLMDRFLYWTDESTRLLKITKLLHAHHRDIPVAPQLVIRQARVYLNSGKLEKAEYILSNLINNSGDIGCWVYQSDSDRALVQAVSVQVRGMILQKLGLWLEAAELIWASLVGYYALPQPDKKGIGTSLGLLANILVSMNDDDFHAFKTNPDIDLSLLGDGSHRLLSAAQAAKMAVVYSQYTSLYVLTNVVTQGTCLVSYSFSVKCPTSQRQSFLLQAKEAFEIGLLTKAEGELVTSKQELHTFLKAAYSLTVVHKWLRTRKAMEQAKEACQIALGLFYDYCHAENQDKDSMCTQIMNLIGQVKLLLGVEPFLNSDTGSFIPDSYRSIQDTPVTFTLEGFTKVMQRFQKYHESLCETTSKRCKGAEEETDGRRLCITSLGTTMGYQDTDCDTKPCEGPKNTSSEEMPQKTGSQSSCAHSCQKSDLGSTDELGSSWQKVSLSGSRSPQPSSSGYTGSGDAAVEHVSTHSLLTTEDDNERSDSELHCADKNKKRDLLVCNPGVSSSTVPRSATPVTSPSNASSDSEKFELIEAAIETLGSEEDCIADVGAVAFNQTKAEGAVQSLSQLTLRTSSSSLGDSFSSQSSWEKISADQISPTVRKPQTVSLPKAGSSESSESSGSFFLMDTLDSEYADSAQDPMYNNHTTACEQNAATKPQHLDQNVDSEKHAVTENHAIKNTYILPQPNPEQCASTDRSSESSFEMVMENHSEPSRNEGTQTKDARNPQCYSCLMHSFVDSRALEKQYFLEEQDYHALLAGVCHECLLKRLNSDKTQFKVKTHRTAHNALHLKFSKATGLWTARETCVYIGEPMNKEGTQRTAIWVQFLHQEERLSCYVGKDYKNPKEIQFHLKDVERQMTAQYYVTEFNKSLYDKEVMAQIFFIPSEALLILQGNKIVGCVTVEPYMLGDFVKLTNNTIKKDMRFQATKYGLAFGHFTYLFSDCQEVVVDLQGWVTANGKGLTYLTDPQIHSIKTPKGPSNFADRGLRDFLKQQHGPECNDICDHLGLPPLAREPQVIPWMF